MKIILSFIFSISFLTGSAQLDSNKAFLAAKGTWEYPLDHKFELSKHSCSEKIFSHATFYSAQPKPIHALMPGLVLKNIKIESMYLIIVKFGDYFLAYANLQKNSLKKGDYITKGQVIGLPEKGPPFEEDYYVEIYLYHERGYIDLYKPGWFKQDCETQPNLTL